MKKLIFSLLVLIAFSELRAQVYGIEKSFIKEIEAYDEALHAVKRTFNYLSVSWSFVSEIGTPINDNSIYFLYSSDFGMTNGFLSVYLFFCNSLS